MLAMAEQCFVQGMMKSNTWSFDGEQYGEEFFVIPNVAMGKHAKN